MSLDSGLTSGSECAANGGGSSQSVASLESGHRTGNGSRHRASTRVKQFGHRFAKKTSAKARKPAP